MQINDITRIKNFKSTIIFVLQYNRQYILIKVNSSPKYLKAKIFISVEIKIIYDSHLIVNSYVFEKIVENGRETKIIIK